MRSCLLIFGLGLCFMACHQDRQLEVKRVDSLIAVLNKQEVVIKKAENRSLAPVINEISSTVKLIADSLKDSLTVPEAILCNRFHNAGVSLNAFESKLPELKEQVTIGKKQLNDLKTDITNNTVSSDSLPAYIEHEENRVSVLSFNINLLDSIRESKINTYDSLKPQLQDLITKYSRH